MQNKKIFILISLVCIVLWLLSIPVLAIFYGLPQNLGDAGEMFGGIGSLFSGLGLAGIIYALILQSKELDEIQKALKVTARLSALTALIQEADAALIRYERWDSSADNSDYSKAKKTVRDKMTAYRQELEKLLKETE